MKETVELYLCYLSGISWLVLRKTLPLPYYLGVPLDRLKLNHKNTNTHTRAATNTFSVLV
jgi:hypothetical protein